MMARPAPIPNVHPSCLIQVIDDSTDPPLWLTVAECFDTPHSIRSAMDRHGLSECWVMDALGDRRYERCGRPTTDRTGG